MSRWQIGWRIFVAVILVGVAWNLPGWLGMDEWVGLVLGAVVGIGAFFALGLGGATGPRSG